MTLEPRDLAVPADRLLVSSAGGSVGDEMARAETAIAWRRERVAVSLRELRRRVHRALRWFHWLSHPFARIAIGLSLGLIMGRRGKTARNRGRRSIQFSACRRE